jgi:NADH:ubiquinone reductase (non-electrogenic)
MKNEINTNEINTNEINTNEINTNEINTNEINTNEKNTNEKNTNEINTIEKNIIKKKRIIIVGSGWAASSFLKHLDPTIVSKKYELIVVSPTDLFVYTPLLINSIFSPLIVTLPIYDLNSFPINYINNKVSNIDFQKNKIFLEKKETELLSSNLDYDYLILAHGSEVNTFQIDGIEKHCYFIKEEKDALKIREQLNILFKSNNNNKYPHNIAVIGTSFAGVELIGQFIDRIHQEVNENHHIIQKYKIYAIDGLKFPLNESNSVIQKYILDLWKKNNVNLYMDQFVTKVDSEYIHTTKNKIPYDIAFWCGGVKTSSFTHKINDTLGIKYLHGLNVNKFLQVKNIDQKNVYAIGDCSYTRLAPTAQVAYQEGKYVASLFNHQFDPEKMKAFQYNHKGQIAYIGQKQGIYFSGKTYFHGNLTKYLNNFIHIYNAIHYKQSLHFSEYFIHPKKKS